MPGDIHPARCRFCSSRKCHTHISIEVVGETRAVTIQASLILAAYRVLYHCLVNKVSLGVDMVADDDTGEEGWQAETDMTQDCFGDIGATPWGRWSNWQKPLKGGTDD